jgi:hypothetical protein
MVGTRAGPCTTVVFASSHVQGVRTHKQTDGQTQPVRAGTAQHMHMARSHVACTQLQRHAADAPTPDAHAGTPEQLGALAAAIQWSDFVSKCLRPKCAPQ